MQCLFAMTENQTEAAAVKWMEKAATDAAAQWGDREAMRFSVCLTGNGFLGEQNLTAQTAADFMRYMKRRLPRPSTIRFSLSAWRTVQEA